MTIVFTSGVFIFGVFGIFIGDYSKFDQHRLKIFGESDFRLQNSTSSEQSQRQVGLKVKMEMALMLTIISTILLGITILQGYLLSVVFRGYRFLKQSIEAQRPTNHLELYEQKY
jgi:hypothetical protein